MQISLIVAMANNRVIGKANQLPWHLSADLKRFKAITLGKPVVMGRKTHESIGKALPDRKNIVLTTDLTYHAQDCQIAHSLDEVFTLLKNCSEEVMIIGGAKLYELFLPLAQRIYLTRVDVQVEGDAFFPLFDESDWVVVHQENHSADARNDYPYSFLVLEKVT